MGFELGFRSSFKPVGNFCFCVYLLKSASHEVFMKAEKLWGKRFEKEPSPLAQKFTAGRDVHEKPAADQRLVPYDIWGSRAHVVMLAKAGILPKKQARILSRGLRQIEDLWQQGKFLLDPAQEDVHTNIESWLTQKYGAEAGGRLHTARSRNDQIAVDMRLYLRDCALVFSTEALFLLDLLIRLAKKYRDQIFPGYTHHQPAQVTTLGHIFIGFGESILRDAQRFQEWIDRFNKNPLGSMTGYGTSLRYRSEPYFPAYGFRWPHAEFSRSDSKSLGSGGRTRFCRFHFNEPFELAGPDPHPVQHRRV